MIFHLCCLKNKNTWSDSIFAADVMGNSGRVECQLRLWDGVMEALMEGGAKPHNTVVLVLPQNQPTPSPQKIPPWNSLYFLYQCWPFWIFQKWRMRRWRFNIYQIPQRRKSTVDLIREGFTKKKLLFFCILSNLLSPPPPIWTTCTIYWTPKRRFKRHSLWLIIQNSS